MGSSKEEQWRYLHQVVLPHLGVKPCVGLAVLELLLLTFPAANNAVRLHIPGPWTESRSCVHASDSNFGDAVPGGTNTTNLALLILQDRGKRSARIILTLPGLGFGSAKTRLRARAGGTSLHDNVVLWGRPCASSVLPDRPACNILSGLGKTCRACTPATLHWPSGESFLCL